MYKTNQASSVSNDVGIYSTVNSVDTNDAGVYATCNSELPRMYPQIYDGTWENDNFTGKTDFMWYITEQFEEYQGQWSRGHRTGQGIIRDITKVY